MCVEKDPHVQYGRKLIDDHMCPWWRVDWWEVFWGEHNYLQAQTAVSRAWHVHLCVAGKVKYEASLDGNTSKITADYKVRFVPEMHTTCFGLRDGLKTWHVPPPPTLPKPFVKAMFEGPFVFS